MSNEKMELIGGVKLDLSFYSGQDLYSEGDMENLLLDLVKNHEESEYNKLIAQNHYWSVLYHLSHIRGNIVDFIKLKPGDKVLEVGSGCGAITQALAKSGADITCIELSKQRSLINAYRNKNRDNIEIKVGNFEDIEKSLDNDFDYIFMIGVFEYGGAYISSDNPYMDFLNKLYSHLAIGGCVYMAIENKFGMKYFAGSREDHTGKFYEGIEGYRDKKGANTFSLKSLKKMAKAASFDVKVMYPYPDYKLPTVIYSDEKLPQVGELSNAILNFDNTRVVAFDEAKAFDEVIAEGEFERYSNSFLLKLQKGERAESFSIRHVIYSKYSNDRADALKIRTDIEKDGYNNLYVVKRPCSEAAKEHIKHINEIYEKLSSAYMNSSLSVNSCKYRGGDDESVEFEYVQGNTLESLFDNCFEKLSGDELKQAILDNLDKYVNAVKSINTVSEFKVSDEFCKIFGKANLKNDLESFEISNIDLIFTNIFTDSKNTVVDYEWTFDFPVPVKFVIYRALFYYFRKDQIRKDFLMQNNLYERYGIDRALVKEFENCEHNFQKYIAGDNVSLIGLHSVFGRDAYNIDYLVNKASVLPNKWKVCVYYDKGQGFSQENTVYYKAECDGDEVKLTIPVDGAVNLRIDPSDEACMIKISEIKTIKDDVEKRVDGVLVNGLYLDNNIIFYKEADPQIIINNTSNAALLEIKYTIDAFGREFYSAVGTKLNNNTGILPKKKGPYEKVRLS